MLHHRQPRRARALTLERHQETRRATGRGHREHEAAGDRGRRVRLRGQHVARRHRDTRQRSVPLIVSAAAEPVR
ncbi:hypothetical protein ABZ297_14505 [Nonomuraea sp. NPDC005983]|uniref:hypothetical protein n=1 Tax=Nonomuraea sp. NPDC005983 TaxID=3155595 RepID=UPI0033B75E4D